MITPFGYVMIGAAALAVVLAIAWWVGERRIAREVAAAPRLTIAQLADGKPARVAGKIADGEVLHAPLSGRACVFYEVTVEESQPKMQSYWRKIIHEVRGVPFAIEDGSARAQIDPTGARATLATDRSTRSGPLEEATPAEESFLARHHMTSKGWFENRKMRFREAALEVGDHVAITGTATRDGDGDGDAIRIAGTASLPLVIEDDPREA